MAKMKGFSGLGRGMMDLSGRRTRKEQVGLPQVSEDKTAFDQTDDTEDRLAAELHDRTLAKRVLSLQKRHPDGSVPEMLIMDYLDSRRERYVYQAQLYGGWVAGGAVPDFMVQRNGQMMALQAMGNYWHTKPGKQESDEAQRLLLLASNFGGERISKVVYVWESRLLRNRNETMEAALAGVELGQ